VATGPSGEARRKPIPSRCQGDLSQGSPAQHRISTKDLEAIQKRALEEGLPYQTLIASLLHKYAAGRLREA
jgi:hypothetical protein